MTTTRRLVFLGQPSLAGTFVRMLTDEGLTVEWIAPDEHPGISDIPQEAMVNLVVIGSAHEIDAAVATIRARFLQQFPESEIRDDDDSGRPKTR